MLLGATGVYSAPFDLCNWGWHLFFLQQDKSLSSGVLKKSMGTNLLFSIVPPQLEKLIRKGIQSEPYEAIKAPAWTVPWRKKGSSHSLFGKRKFGGNVGGNGRCSVYGPKVQATRFGK